MVDPLCYPLLFLHGTPGYSGDIPHNRASRRGNMGRVSMREFYAHRLSYRLNTHLMFQTQKLLQQYMVDAYVKTERNRLDYIEANQHTLRRDSYTGLTDYLRTVAEEENRDVGSIYILPSTFTGSERYMRQAYQDAMAIVRKYGKPCLFITFTANPNWQEIKDEIARNPHTSRPDLCNRVFYAKFKEFLDDLVKRQILGATEAHVCMVEFQKRGLPHAHILLFMKQQDKVTTAETVDNIIWAEIPNQETHPELFELVCDLMIHQCDSRCLENGRCKRNFPKPYSDETVVLDDKITRYKRRRPQEGVPEIIKNGKVLNNGKVVTYNPYFTLKYNCHINFEWCSSVENVKYLFKYVFKGHDMGKIVIERSGNTEVVHYNEIKHYVDGRFVSSFEAFYRLYEFDLHFHSHSIERLQVHLPNEQRIFVQSGANEQEIREACGRDSMLMAFFRLNVNDPEAREFTYSEIPMHYWYDKTQRRWVRRIRNVDNKKLARMYNVNPRNAEILCLRTLLFHVKGPTSYEALRTVNGVTHESFRLAAIALGLIEAEDQWRNCIKEAVDCETNIRKIRFLFATICIQCSPTNPNPAELWAEFRTHLIRDFVRNHDSEEVATNKALQVWTLILKAIKI